MPFVDLENAPIWATGVADGALVIGAYLPTKDGRYVGNATIVLITSGDSSSNVGYTVMTDTGILSTYSALEITKHFYPPMWVKGAEEVLEGVVITRY